MTISKRTMDDLVQSRMEGRGEVHFFAIESARKISDYLDAQTPHSLNHARFMMAGAVQSLYEALKKDGAYPEQK